jgi:hypothetical protein
MATLLTNQAKSAVANITTDGEMIDTEVIALKTQVARIVKLLANQANTFLLTINTDGAL